MLPRYGAHTGGNAARGSRSGCVRHPNQPLEPGAVPDNAGVVVDRRFRRIGREVDPADERHALPVTKWRLGVDDDMEPDDAAATYPVDLVIRDPERRRH